MTCLFSARGHLLVLAVCLFSLPAKNLFAADAPAFTWASAKDTNNPPQGSPFVTYEGLPSDFYLKLVGSAAKMIRRETPATEVLSED